MPNSARYQRLVAAGVMDPVEAVARMRYHQMARPLQAGIRPDFDDFAWQYVTPSGTWRCHECGLGHAPVPRAGDLHACMNCGTVHELADNGTVRRVAVDGKVVL